MAAWGMDAAQSAGAHRPALARPARRDACFFPALLSRRIDEIMNHELLAVLPDTPVQAVRALLRHFAISAAPVLDERRRPLGVVTARALLDGGGTAADRMTRPAPCVEGCTDIQE